MNDRMNHYDPTSNDICRMLITGDKTLVSVCEEKSDKMKVFLNNINLKTELRKPTFYKELLQALELNPDEYILEPSDEFIEDRSYNCRHTLEFVCNKDIYTKIYSDIKINEVHRGENDFRLEPNFGDIMYCVYEDDRVVAMSYYRPNHDKFEGTYAMQVSTRKEFRNKGYGKAVANAATADVCNKDGLALWVCQVENHVSIKIAENLGYIFLGGEIRIMK